MSQPLTGLSAWVVQRLSAVYLALFSIGAGIGVAVIPVPDFDAWRDLFAHPVIGTAVILFFVALLLHCWVGMRDVILDYAGQSAGLRFALLSLLGGWLLALAVWALRIVLAVGLA